MFVLEEITIVLVFRAEFSYCVVILIMSFCVTSPCSLVVEFRRLEGSFSTASGHIPSGRTVSELSSHNKSLFDKITEILVISCLFVDP